MQEPNIPESLQEVESILRQLSPRPSAIDRDQLMYRAGAAAARRRRFFWPIASLALAVCLAVVMFFRTGNSVERIVYVPVPASPTSAIPAIEFPVETAAPIGHSGEYLRLRDRVLAKGLDALPAPSGGPAGSSVRDLRRGHNGDSGGRESF
jgi:hypothetical protein